MVASLFSVYMRTVQHIWKQSDIFGGESQNKTKKCGRKKIQIDFAKFREIPLQQWSTLRSLASSLKTNKTSLFRLLKSGII